MIALKVNDFALLEGKMVQIVRIRMNSTKAHVAGQAIYDVQIKLHNDNLRHWVDSKSLQPLSCQKAPKILYSEK